MNWQPIETAPTDGREVLLYGWRPHSGPSEAGIVIGSYEVGGYTEGWTDDRGSDYYPTHWMPLPEPPA